MNKIYKSPTTPGLDIDFRNYIIELVCLNLDKKLGPKFWKSNTYWSSKYKREIRGFSNLISSFNSPVNEDIKVNLLEQPLAKKILIQIIKKMNIKSLSAKKTIDRIVLNTKKIYMSEILERYNEKESEEIKIDMNKNSKFIDVVKKNKRSSIRQIENNG
jgi:hypothetical protein